MKRYICAAMALVMIAALFTGCGCTNRNVSNDPNGQITQPSTMMPTVIPEPSTTHATTEPTHMTTEPTRETAMTDPMIGGTDTTNNTEGTNSSTNPSENARARTHHNGPRF